MASEVGVVVDGKFYASEKYAVPDLLAKIATLTAERDRAVQHAKARDIELHSMRDHETSLQGAVQAQAKEIARLTDALSAEKAARRKLTELLDAQMGTPCEQIRHQQALTEKGESDGE